MLDRSEMETWARYKARFDALAASATPVPPGEELAYQHYMALTARLRAGATGITARRPEESLGRTRIMSLGDYLRRTRRRATEIAKPQQDREPQSRGKRLVYLDMLMYQFKAHFCRTPRINEQFESDARRVRGSPDRAINSLLICYLGLLRDMHEACTAYILNHEKEREEESTMPAYTSPGMAAVALAFHKPVTRVNHRLNTVEILKGEVAAASSHASELIRNPRPNLLILYPDGGDHELQYVRTTPHAGATVSMDEERQQQTGWAWRNDRGRYYLDGDIPPLDRNRYLSGAASG